MKKIKISIVFLSIIFASLGQSKQNKTNTVSKSNKDIETKESMYSEKDIYNVKAITFYGFDFSKFHFSDPKRMGQDLKKYMLSLTGYLSEHATEKKLKMWLEKESITFSYNAILVANKKTNNDELITPIKVTISKDSIQSMINKYILEEKGGIGYVIIYECFDNDSKTVSAYSVFFDIATKKVLKTEYASRKESNSFNRLSDWDPAAWGVIKKLTDIYLDKKEATNTLSE